MTSKKTHLLAHFCRRAWLLGPPAQGLSSLQFRVLAVPSFSFGVSKLIHLMVEASSLQL